DEGQGQADDGQQPGDDADVDGGLPDQQGEVAGGGDLDHEVLGAHDHPDHTVAQDGEDEDDDEAADQAELFADDGEDEVVVGLGQPGPLLPAGAESDPEPAAGGQGEQSVVGLPGLSHGVGRGLVGMAGEHGLDAFEAVLGAEDEEHDGRGQDAAQQQEVLHREAADEQAHHGHGHEDEAGAEVVAADDEADGDEHTGYDGDHGVAEGRHPAVFLGEDETEPQGQCDLEEFGGLDLEAAEADPVRIA